MINIKIIIILFNQIIIIIVVGVEWIKLVSMVREKKGGDLHFFYLFNSQLKNLSFLECKMIFYTIIKDKIRYVFKFVKR